MDDEKLIDLVRSNEIIYNKFTLGYRFPDKKKRVWSVIAEELGVTEEQCTKRWTNLRERFGRESKKLEAPSGAACGETWPLFNALSFLKKHVKPRPKRRTTNILKDSSDSSLCSSLTSPSPQPDPVGIYADEAAPHSAVRPRKRKAVSSGIDEEFREVLDSYKLLCKQQKKNVAVHAFGEMIVATVSSMSTRMQTIAMQKVTEFVMTLKSEDEADQFTYDEDFQALQ